MARFIFIFPFILVCFLTIVSKNAFARYSTGNISIEKLPYSENNDSVISIMKDDFEDGDISDWINYNDWEASSLDKINGNYSMKNKASGISGVSSTFHTIDGDLSASGYAWNFTIKNSKWDPSSSNKFWFYLSSDALLPEIINGWAVGVNISGTSDMLQLWRIKKGKADSLIIQTGLDWNATTQVAIGLERTVKGEWTLTYQKAGDANSFSFHGIDRSVFEFKNIGVYFKYTATRAGQLWIDDVAVGELAPKLTIQNLTLLDASHLSITFNLPVDPSSLQIPNFELKDENGISPQIIKVSLSALSDKTAILEFSKIQGVELKLHVSGINGVLGFGMEPETHSFSYTFLPQEGALLINEVLFNPFSGGVDFVELVNVADYPVSVGRLRLATRNDTLGLKQVSVISAEKRYLFPGEFLVCTKDSGITAMQYFSSDPETFCQMKSFPTYADDGGKVVLLNDSLEVLDEFSYSAKMHSSFLADEEGVSLERISLEKPTNDRNNWASAAASVGFATPGLPNSQTSVEYNIQDKITCEPDAFSPNGDGYNDVLTIHYKMNKPGYVANVRIFDAAGRQVKYLVKNQSQSQEGNWMWEGENDNGRKMNIGIYIILVETFDQNGQTKTFKETCTLTDRL